MVLLVSMIPSWVFVLIAAPILARCLTRLRSDPPFFGLMALLLEVGMTAPVAALVRGPADAVDACASVQSAAGDCACDCGAMAHR